jgi:hypothetical protein
MTGHATVMRAGDRTHRRAVIAEAVKAKADPAGEPRGGVSLSSHYPGVP